MAKLKKISGPDEEGLYAIYYAEKQDIAHQRGAYDYLSSIAMVPKNGTIAAYIKEFGLRKILDVGSGTADILDYLDRDVTYLGIDISPTAIEKAKKRFIHREHTSFYAADFWQWDCPAKDVDCVVWAGIGCTWTHEGREGSHEDWRDILSLAERPLKEGGYFILEFVTRYWPTLERMIDGRYEYVTGCDLNCFQSELCPERSIRVLRATA